MTLLARALYDNLADAPDELSFRKGDIVTVIERDVDGIVGWWLCLLHGRQGIVPGNRLQIIPPVEVNSSFRNAGSQGSLSADDLSDSFDANFSDSVHGPEYDILPAPVKATHGQIYDYPSPKNIKDVYTSDRNSGSLITYPNYATPKRNTTNSDYDIVPSKPGINTKMSPAELYDIPQAVNTTRDAEQLYDFPSRRPTIQQKTSTPSPRSSKPDFQNVVTSFTSIPEGKQGKEDGLPTPVNKSNSELYGNSDIYDTPKSMKSASQELYDVPPSLSSKVVSGKRQSPRGSPSDLYDVIPAKNTTSAEELYDVPPSSFNFRNENASLQKRQETSHDIYNVPPATNNNVVNQIDNNIRNKIQLQNANGDPRQIFNYLPRKEVNNQSPAHQEDIYDHPPARQDIRDQPQNEDIYDHPPARQNIRDQSQNEDIYDHPPARQYLRDQPQNEDIYDHPPVRQNIRDQSQNEDIYDHPPARQDIYDHPPSQEIYDEPSHENLYDHLPRGNARKQPQQESIYDRPPNRHIEDNVDGSQGLYDVPTQHDIGKVMRDISQYETSKQSLIKPYGKHRRERNNANLPLNSRRVSEDDDDYVDYQDIYGKEPPAEMVKEMEKSSETTPRSPPPKTIRKHSSFEQINMEAVKELKITQKQAFERLSKLHLAVDTSVTTLVAHTSGDWLAPRNLSYNIDAIKDMSAKVKLSLRLLTEFGLGAVVNARVVEDSGKMADTIKADIEPLLECYYKIKVCILHLDGCKWKVPDTREKETEKFFATVNAIMILGSRVPEACRKLTGTLHYSVKNLFSEDPVPVVESSSIPLTERMENLRLKSQRSKSPEPLSAEKGKLKQVQKAVDAKKVREILELDTRSKWNWSESDGLPVEKPEGADLSPHEMRKEFQSRRQQGYNSTLPRRPPVPPKPSLPSNRRSMASTMPDDELRPTPAPSKVDTLVTDFVAEDGRKKYASDPTQSPLEPEPARKPEWGGSCPQLDDRSTYASPQPMGRATSSGTAASTTSTYSSNHDSTDDIDGVNGLNKMPSDSNLYSQTLTPPRVTAPPSPSHLRAASLPWDDNKIPFSSYEKEQRNTPNHSPRMNQKRLSKLDHRDTEALIFFLQRVESQVLILREAVRNLTESVTNNEAPQMFVAHSKFVILTAHKVVHAGEELSGKLMNSNVKFQIKRSAAQLADSIRGVVAGTKQAALDYPNQNSMMEMMTTVLSVGEAVREVHKEAKKGLEL